MVTVDVFTMGYNEEKILPHFIKHYKQFCRNITFYNNCSTDNSVDICKSNGVEVIDTGLDEINELEYIRVKQNSYLNSKADFVVVVDTDEFVYHPDILKLLKYYKEQSITLPKVRGYTKATDDGYPTEGLLTDKVKTGIVAINYAKRCIFDPRLRMGWGIGMHSLISCNGPVKESEQQDISILHYKFLDREETHKRKLDYANRISQFNKNNSFATHYFKYDRNETENWFQEHVNKAIIMI